MQIVAFRIDENLFGIDLKSVEKVIMAVETMAIPSAPETVRGLINIRGSTLLIYNLRKALQLPLRDLEIEDQFIFCAFNQEIFGLWVDEVLEIMTISDEELLPADQPVPHLQYVLKKNDRFILIYDWLSFLQLEANQPKAEALL